jgi:hypothetical protein
VDNQIVKPDPNCDFENLVPGTEEYIQAEFSFSSEWNGCVKVASFWSTLGKEYPAQALKDGKTCIIPIEALNRRSFKMQLIGKNKKLKLTTNKLTINQNGGGV